MAELKNRHSLCSSLSRTPHNKETLLRLRPQSAIINKTHEGKLKCSTMSPPVTPSASKDGFVNNGFVNNGAPYPGCFPPNTVPNLPVYDCGSQSATGNPMMVPSNLTQLQASQLESLQQPQLTSVYSGTQVINPNQFVMMTTTTTQMPPQVSLSQRPIPQAQASMWQTTAYGAPSANEFPPFLKSDHNLFLQAYQQNVRALQQNAEALQQAQMQFTKCSEPPNTIVSNQISQPDANIPMQQCVDIINQALKDPQYAAAGQVLLQAMQSSSTYINSLMNQPQKFVQAHQAKPVLSQDTIKTFVLNQEPPFTHMNSVKNPPQKLVQIDEPKTEVSQDTIKTFIPNQQLSFTDMNSVINPPQKLVQVDEPKKEVSQDTIKNFIPNQEFSATHMNSFMNQPRKSVQFDESKSVVSQDTIESFFPNQVFLASNLEHVEREDTDNNDAEEEMWKILLATDDGGVDISHKFTLAPSPSFSGSPTLVDSSSLVETQLSQNASPVKSSTRNHPMKPFPPLSLNNAPVLHKADKVTPARADCGKVKKPPQPRKGPPTAFQFEGSPQQYLMAILKERGYSANRIPNSETGYQSGPTPLQLASFGTQVVKAVNAGDVSKLSSLLDCGLSPNPCNSFGDFIVHLVCKRANIDILQCLVDHGCSLEVRDSFGRTPLHCVAWAGEFCRRSAELILDKNWKQILVEDNHGRWPLDYVRKQDYPIWIEFLRSKMDTYWPIGGTDRNLVPSIKHEEGVATISLDLVSAIANGDVDPEAFADMDEFMRMHYTKGNPNIKDLLTS